MPVVKKIVVILRELVTKPGEMFPREKSGDKSGRSKHDPRGEQYRSLQPERAEFKPETQHGEHSVKKPSSNIGITSTKSDIKDGYEPVVSTKIFSPLVQNGRRLKKRK